MGGNGFLTGFLKSWGVILASEIGDKTFFIAAIMAMKHSRQQVRRGPARAPAAATALGPPLLLIYVSSLSSMLCHPLLLQVFIGAIGALAAMTVLSAGLGWAAPNLVRLCTGWLAAAALA